MTITRRGHAVFDPRITLTPPAPAPWSKDAACVGLPTELFVPDGFKESPDRAAHDVCAACPVRNECLETALADPSLVGLWGGTTTRQRQAIRNRKNRSRRVHPCGTPAAYRRHQRNSEIPCDACVAAYQESRTA